MPHHFEQSKTTNWPLIILVIIAIIVVFGLLVYFFLIKTSSESISVDEGTFPAEGEGIAIGEPNPQGCGEDLYNCEDFQTQQDAQAVYNLCFEQGAGDIHQLDNDGDGEVCEGLE